MFLTNTVPTELLSFISVQSRVNWFNYVIYLLWKILRWSWKASISGCYMFSFTDFTVNFSQKTYRKMVTNRKGRYKTFYYIIWMGGWNVVNNGRAGFCYWVSLDTNCDKSKYSIKLKHFLFKFILKSKMKPAIKIISMCVVCAIDNSSSNRSIHSEVVLGGR